VELCTCVHVCMCSCVHVYLGVLVLPRDLTTALAYATLHHRRSKKATIHMKPTSFPAITSKPQHTVYTIQCTRNNKLYVGQTSNFPRQVSAHKSAPMKCMREDVFQFGWEAFHFHAHATFSEKSCANKMEKQLIQQKSTQNPAYGYNMCMDITLFFLNFQAIGTYGLEIQKEGVMCIVVACHACLAYLRTEICNQITCNSWTTYKYSIRLSLQTGKRLLDTWKRNLKEQR